MKQFLIVLCLAIFCVSANATVRSAKQRYAFMKANPCPATVPHSKNSCPGFVVDHVTPLCAGGPDLPSNMQWQTVAAAKLKDKEEWKLCRSMKKAP